jgi:NADPH:quinone reductase-like Zn-dependent oxidoreductase
MKAVQIHAHGGIEQLQLDDIAEPCVKPSEVLVEIKACGLNHMDLWVRKGLPGIKIALPHIPGCDISGVISELGSEVNGFKVGDEVIVSPGTSCGNCAHCWQGNDSLCRHYGIIGETSNGGYTERISIPAQNILAKPKNLTFEEAAAMPLVFLTAWHMLVHQGKIAPGMGVLIHSAGSGVGSAAIQIAKLFNATVITTAGSNDKLVKAKELGADYILNYREEDWSQKVKEITHKHGVDLIVEHLGGEIFEKSTRLLCKGGRLITCGATTGYQVSLDLRYIFFKQLKILGSTMGSKGELLEVMKHAKSGHLKPVVDRTFPLKEAQAAQKYLEERKQFGKVLLIP